MSEINNKYKIGVRRFNINWIGIKSLVLKENLRFLSVAGQTIVGPIITAILFLTVINLAIGDSRSDVLGVVFINFLAPGLIAMQFISQSFAHSSSSILMGKVMGNIVDLIGAPLSSAEVTLSIISASITRAIIITFLSIIIFSIFINIKIEYPFLLVMYVILCSFILGAAGICAGLWADKFDNMATITNFVIVPLSFLSGTFYSVSELPSILKTLSYYNPFFYMIDGFRFAFIGQSDGSIKIGLRYLIILALMVWLLSYLLYKKGYKIKS